MRVLPERPPMQELHAIEEEEMLKLPQPFLPANKQGF